MKENSFLRRRLETLAEFNDKWGWEGLKEGAGPHNKGWLGKP